MDFEVSTTPSDVVKKACLFAADHLEPVASELDHLAAYPQAIMNTMAADGYLGLLAPVEHGGGGIGFRDYVNVVLALSGSCAGVASITNAHTLATYAITQWGTDRQKESYLPALARGGLLGACALHEAGPTPATLPDALIASPQASGYVLNGRKSLVRNTEAAQVFIVFAAIQSETGISGLRPFIVDAKTPGVTAGPKVESMGLTACPVADLNFANVKVDSGSMLGSEADGPRIVDHLLAIAAVMEAAQAVGIATAAVKHAAEHAKRRVQFHHPVADLQAVQTLLAEVRTNSYLGWLGVQHAAQLVDASATFEVEAAMLKSYLARSGPKMLVDCCQVEGGLGISESAPKGIRESLPLARMFRDMAGATLLDAPADFPDRVIAASLCQ